MKIRIALTAATSILLAACGSTEDASTEAEADTVEVPADQALTGVDAEPMADPAATADDDTSEDSEVSASEQDRIQQAGDKAADTAAAAMDALADDSAN